MHLQMSRRLRHVSPSCSRSAPKHTKDSIARSRTRANTSPRPSADYKRAAVLKRPDDVGTQRTAVSEIDLQPEKRLLEEPIVVVFVCVLACLASAVLFKDVLALFDNPGDEIVRSHKTRSSQTADRVFSLVTSRIYTALSCIV